MRQITSLLCVVTAILTFLFNIIIVEYGYILLMRKLNLNKSAETIDEDHIDTLKVTQAAEIQREFLCKRFGCNTLRKYFFQGSYSTMTDDDVKVGLFIVFHS